MDGGEPVQLTREGSTEPSVSPDGKLIACMWKSDKPNTYAGIALIPFSGGAPLKIIDASATGRLKWTSDGRAVFFCSYLNGVTNIWMQPIDSGPPKQVTSFREGSITSFDVSPDSKRIICSRRFSDTFIARLENSR